MNGRIVIWQIFTRLFGNGSDGNCIPDGTAEENGCGKFNSYTTEVLEYFRNQGATHLWFTGILAHASQTDYSGYGIPTSHGSAVKGKAGSPYAVRDYFDVDPDLAQSVENRNRELDSLIARVHSLGMGFIMDFVPNHVAREYHSANRPDGVADLGENDDTDVRFSPRNNFYYIPGSGLGGPHNWNGYTENPARATGNDCFSPAPSEYDWYETVKLNYGKDYSDNTCHFDPVPDTWIKMTDILSFWAAKGIDGFRCDMAEMVPVEFWHYAIPRIKSEYPQVLFIAEIYNPGAYQTYTGYGCFDYIYDKVGLYDTLRRVITGNESAAAITGCWQQTGECGDRMLHFLENHDEQRIASDFFAGDGESARSAMIVTSCMDNCPVMVYAGQELGERGMDSEGFSGLDGRTTIFDYWSPDTLHRLYNGGRIDGSRLTDKEKQLQKFYSDILHICSRETAITNGRFFDLMYVNPQSPEFNAYRTYAFLRSEGKETLLIVANFDNKTSFCGISIPLHAFEYLGIAVQERCLFRDLISGYRFEGCFNHISKVRVNVPAHSGVILKIECV